MVRTPPFDATAIKHRSAVRNLATRAVRLLLSHAPHATITVNGGAAGRRIGATLGLMFKSQVDVLTVTNGKLVLGSVTLDYTRPLFETFSHVSRLLTTPLSPLLVWCEEHRAARAYKTIRVEKNIPLPPVKRMVIARGWGVYPFSRMQVGDSFFCPDRSPNQLFGSASGWNRVHNAPHKWAARVVNGGARIWRIK